MKTGKIRSRRVTEETPLTALLGGDFEEEPLTVFGGGGLGSAATAETRLERRPRGRRLWRWEGEERRKGSTLQ